MSRQLIRVGSVAILFAVLGSACGGDDDGPPPISSGLPDGQKLSQLEPADAASVCQAVVDGANEYFPRREIDRVNCTLSAVLLSLGSESGSAGPKLDLDKCEDLTSRCLAGEKLDEGSASIDLESIRSAECDDPTASARISECEATVGDYEMCVTAFFSTVSEVLHSFTCELFMDAKAAQRQLESFGAASDREECKALNAQCDDLIGDFGADDGAN